MSTPFPTLLSTIHTPCRMGPGACTLPCTVDVNAWNAAAPGSTWTLPPMVAPTIVQCEPAGTTRLPGTKPVTTPAHWVGGADGPPRSADAVPVTAAVGASAQPTISVP